MMARWEYKVLVLDDKADSSEVRLNTLGAGGWELVGIVGRFPQEQFAYLKRRAEKEPA
jgi:hypothetical protein